MVVTRSLRLSIMGDARDVGNSLADVQVVLFSNDGTPNADSVVGDFDLVTVAGMEAQDTIAPAAPFDPGDGRPVCDVPTVPFVATSAVGLPISIWGWLVLNTAGTVVLGGERLAESVNIEAIGDGVDVNAHIKWGQ